MLENAYINKPSQPEKKITIDSSSALQLKDNRTPTLLRKKNVDGILSSTVLQKKTNTTGLPDNLKSGIENLSGYSMDDVKVHYNSSQPAQLNAHAYAQGTNIHVAPGQEKHLPHEAWHVVQQKQGRVKPTMQMKGSYINDNRGLEKEADAMGSRAIQLKSDVSFVPELAPSNPIPVFQLSALSDAGERFKLHEDDLQLARKKFDKESNDIKGSPNGFAAMGLDHWATETQQAAIRHYNELHYISNFKGDRNLRMGMSNVVEPDIVGQKGKDKYHVEIKTTNSALNSEVNELVVNALTQLEKRKPGTGWYAEVGIYLENKSNKWPWGLFSVADPHTASNADFITALKKQTSIKGYFASNYPDVRYVTFRVYYSYGAGGYVSHQVDINAL